MSGVQCSRLQLPLKLAWAVTIHKAQGLTLDNVVIDVGTKEFSSGLTYVACSRVRRLSDLLFDPPFPYQHLANLGRSQRLQERLNEDARLQQLQATTIHCQHSSSDLPQLSTLTAPDFSSISPLTSSPTPSFSPMVATHLSLSSSTLLTSSSVAVDPLPHLSSDSLAAPFTPMIATPLPLSNQSSLPPLITTLLSSSIHSSTPVSSMEYSPPISPAHNYTPSLPSSCSTPSLPSSPLCSPTPSPVT